MSKLTGYEEELKKSRVLNIQMNILNKCTSRCLSCRKYTWPNDMLSMKDIGNTLCTLKKMLGLETVVFSGGDPLLHPDMKRIVALCEELGLKYSVITTLVTNNKELVELIAKTAYRIHVSVDATDAKLYEAIRGVNGFKKMESNLELIHRVRPADMIPVRISSTVSKFNYYIVDDLYKFAKKHGCLINFYFLHTWGNLVMSEENKKEFYDLLEKIALDEQKSKKRISNAVGLITKKFSFESGHSACTKCYLPHVSAVINANGDIYPCCRLMNDNGEYGSQVKYAYGNIVGKSVFGIMREFEKRFTMEYPIAGSLCDECGQRYEGVLEEMQKVIENKREPIFF